MNDDRKLRNISSGKTYSLLLTIQQVSFYKPFYMLVWLYTFDRKLVQSKFFILD